MEGGGCWFDRRVRDHIYDQNSRLTSTDDIRRLIVVLRKLSKGEDILLDSATDLQKTVFQQVAVFLPNSDCLRLLMWISNFQRRLARNSELLPNKLNLIDVRLELS